MALTKDDLMTGKEPLKLKVLANGGFGAGKCVTGDTLLIGSDGRVNTMEEVYKWKRYSVLAFDGDKLHAIEPTNFIRKFADETIEIKTCSGRKIRGTPEHPLLTIDGWKRLDELSTKDEVFVSSNLECFVGTEDTISTDFCELLGYIIGDGNVTQQKCTISINEKIIASHVEKICKRLGYSFSEIKTNQRCPAYCVSGKDLKLRLIELGIWGRTSHSKNVPQEIFSQSNEKVSAFLNGLFTCDGTLYKMKRPNRPITSTIYGLSYTTVNPRLAQEVGILLSRFDIPFSIRERKVKYKELYDHKAFEVTISRWQGKKAFVEKIGLEKSKEIQEEVRLKKTDKVTMKLFDAHCVKDRIKSVNRREGAWVYDLTVPQHHNYLANGIVCHNTYFAMTFPKWAYCMVEPNGILTARTNKKLLDNMVVADSFIPNPDEDIKMTFERMAAFIKDCRERAKNGEIETLIVDNLTYLSTNRWEYINKYEKLITKSGESDTRGMYGTLGRWLYKFTLTELLTFPANLVVTCHEMAENEEAMSDKVDKTTPIVSNILGGFREKAAGLFNASIFLEVKRIGDNSYKHTARCRKGNLRDAKNNIGLPEIVENVSYQSMVDAINNSTKQG